MAVECGSVGYKMRDLMVMSSVYFAVDCVEFDFFGYWVCGSNFFFVLMVFRFLGLVVQFLSKFLKFWGFWRNFGVRIICFWGNFEIEMGAV